MYAVARASTLQIELIPSCLIHHLRFGRNTYIEEGSLREFVQIKLTVQVPSEDNYVSTNVTEVLTSGYVYVYRVHN